MKTRIELDFANGTVKCADIPDDETPVSESHSCAACAACINGWRKHAAKLRNMADRMSKTPSGAPPTFEITAEILIDCASELEAQHSK